MAKGFTCIIALLMMASCGVYTTFQPIENLTETDTLGDSVSLASMSWRELFTDSCLQILIEEGLANNTDLQIALQKVNEAEAVLQASSLVLLPSISFIPQGTVSSFDGSKGIKSYSLATSVSWELVFGKQRNAKEGAKAVVEQSRAYRQAVRTRLIATVANSYYMLLMFDEQQAIYDQALVNREEQVRVLKLLKQNGVTTEVAVAQAEADKLKVEALLLSLKKQIQAVENSLSVLLGRVPGIIDRGILAEQSFAIHISAGIPLQLLRDRPDVRQSEQELVQAFYATNEARAAFYPSVSLSGITGWTNDNGTIVNPGGWLFNAVGSLVQPLFNRGTNIARLKVRRAQQEEALFSFRQRILDAGEEVNNALTQWQVARKRQELDEQQVAALQTAVHDTWLLMQHGSSNYLEVLTVQQALLQAELTTSEDKFDEIQGAINLYHALGGGGY